MIDFKDGVIHIKTKNNSYIFKVNEYADLESIYYGGKIDKDGVKALQSNRTFIVNTLFQECDPTYCIDGMNFEYSYPFRGDSRSASLIVGDNNSSMSDFTVESVIANAIPLDCDMPIPKGYDDSICICLRDKLRSGLELQLWYLVYEESDIVARFTRLVNGGEDIVVRKIMSAQYDISQGNREIVVFDGAWGRERQMKKTSLNAGKFTNGSYSGMSSAECSPFFMVKDVIADEKSGDVFAFNLIYSASHEIGAQVTPYGGLRITHGVQSEGFAYKLRKGESFTTPVAISTFSDKGVGKASENMQRFVSQKIAPKKNIPIMLNSWEFATFSINETQLSQLAVKAKALGFDGIVIDDGWFVGRSDDTAALGDWIEDKKKFPSGIKAFADRLKEQGMKLGIWIEPEMISEESMLYKAHTEWALKEKRARSIVGRNQMILDLTCKEVENYVLNSLAKLVDEYGASYIKWDFNRRFSDIIGIEGSAYFYRYTCALYRILKTFTQRYPDVILENCASGGGRFDLGMLSFCPMGWVSDNTDPLSRAAIQEGTSYGFPIRTFLNHISHAPSYQTKRHSKFSARRDTAIIGQFGVQYDITKISDDESNELKSSIKRYRELKSIIDEGILYRISPNEDIHIWQVLSGDKGLIYFMNKRFATVSQLPIVKLVGLDEESLYRIYGENIDVTATGRSLMRAGFNLPMNYQGIEGSKLEICEIDTLILYIEKKECEQ